MNTPPNPSPNYEAILQRIEEEIEGWKAKLSAKDIRVNLLTKQQKEMQTKLEATQRELEATQTRLQTIESELRSTQSELKATQLELRNTQMVSPKDGMEMVYVPGGKFLQGSRNDDPDAKDNEKPQHEVYLDPYWIDITPVTNAMFAKFVAETGYQAQGNWQSKAGKGRENHPVVNVTWHDAQAYAKWAGRRLPTEAEWEKAASGTDGRKWPWGNEPPTPSLANIWKSGIRDTTPVGNYPDGVSPYGALDMAGNVWEWCHDTYSANYYTSYPKTNPQGPQQPSKAKVIHGGAWTSPPQNCRTRYRDGSDANSRRERNGFRCARSLFLDSDKE